MKRSGWWIRPQHTLEKDIPGKLPAINLYGRSKVQLGRVKDVITNTWMTSGDIKDAWLRGTTVADIINNASVSGEDICQSVCACQDEHDRNAEMHTCGMCDELTLCALMVLSLDNQKVCHNCQTTEESGLATYHIKAPKLLFQQEAKVQGMSHERVKELWSEAEGQLRPHMEIDTWHWHDTYLGIDRTLQETTLLRERHPFAYSVDAVFPYLRLDDGTTGIHVRDNMVINIDVP